MFVVYTVDVVMGILAGGGTAGVDVGAVWPPLPSAAVTGQMVVYKLITSVVTLPILDGQSVTVGAQDVIVYTCVVYTVDVVMGVVAGGGTAGVDVAAVWPPLLSVSVTGQMVVVTLITSVVTLPILAGQSVTVGAQDVIVYTCVL